MSEDPFAPLEAAVGEIREAAQAMLRERDALQRQVDDLDGTVGDLVEVKRDRLDGADRIAELERERAAIKTRLLRLRARLEEVAIAPPESNDDDFR